jgi:hypothetical protein
VIRAKIKDQLPGGKYAIEDKTGDNAFDIAQAKDYAKRADQSLARRQDGELDVGRATGGFKRTQNGTTSEYDGLIYVFSRQSEAEKALKRMTDVEAISKVLGEPARRHSRDVLTPGRDTGNADEASREERAMKETDYYPSFISLDIEHSDDVPTVQLAVEYARCLREAGRGEVVAYSLPGMDGENIPGTERQLKERLQDLRWLRPQSSSRSPPLRAYGMLLPSTSPSS